MNRKCFHMHFCQKTPNMCKYMQNSQNSILSKKKWIAHQYNPIWELKNEENMQNHWDTWNMEQKWWRRWVGVPRWKFRPKIFFDEKKKFEKKNIFFGRNFHLGSHIRLFHLICSTFWIFRLFQLPVLLFTTPPISPNCPTVTLYTYHRYIYIYVYQCVGSYLCAWVGGE